MSTIGQHFLDERRNRRLAGVSRITPEGRELLLRLATGDLMDEFQAALDSDVECDALSDALPRDPRYGSLA